jgi:putative chitinase
LKKQSKKKRKIMLINRQQILRALVGIATPPSEALSEFVASLNMWSETFNLNTPLRMCMYLAQVLHESNYLRSQSENLNYSAEGLMRTWPKRFDRAKAEAYARQPEKIANCVYANRMGNGDEASGDGWRYRGRGYIMLTGKEQYIKFSKFDLCDKDVVADPDAVSRYYLNQLASLWYWEKHNLNAIADIGDVEKATKVINGGNNGLANRKLLYRRFCKEFGVKNL